MGFSRTLAVWSSGLSFDDLPEAVVPWVKAEVLDFLAVGAAGSQAVGVGIRAMLEKIRFEPHPEMAGVDFTQGARTPAKS
jgi:2-methylcitrate dehydratase PrpD